MTDTDALEARAERYWTQWQDHRRIDVEAMQSGALDDGGVFIPACSTSSSDPDDWCGCSFLLSVADTTSPFEVLVWCYVNAQRHLEGLNPVRRTPEATAWAEQRFMALDFPLRKDRDHG